MNTPNSQNYYFWWRNTATNTNIYLGGILLTANDSMNITRIYYPYALNGIFRLKIDLIGTGTRSELIG